MPIVGKLYGEVSPTSFNILLSDTSIGRGNYVKVNHDLCGWVLARVESTKRYIDSSGAEIDIARARTIGYRADGNILIPRTAFKPDEKVHSADNELILDVLGLRKQKTSCIYVGFLEGHDIPVYLDVKKTIAKHMAILAKTGAGKSYTVGVILEELLKYGMPIVVIDPHGEYSGLRYENEDYDALLKFGLKTKSYADQITEYSVNVEANPYSKRLCIKTRFDIDELIEIMPMKLNDKQKLILFNALKQVEGRDYTLNELISIIKLDKSKAKWKVVSGLESLKSSGIFDGRPIHEKELVRENHASIINLKGADPSIQALVVAKISKDLFNARSLNQIPGFFLLLEEAQNFCPERSFGEAISSNILRTIAFEGRKFEIHLCVVSQRPTRIDKNVLSQCSTQIILKITNPNDLKTIGQSIEGFTPGMEEEIRQLPVGHALIVGPVEQPITVTVRTRETKHESIYTRITKEETDKKKSIKREKKGKKKTMLQTVKSIFLKDVDEVS